MSFSSKAIPTGLNRGQQKWIQWLAGPVSKSGYSERVHEAVDCRRHSRQWTECTGCTAHAVGSRTQSYRDGLTPGEPSLARRSIVPGDAPYHRSAHTAYHLRRVPARRAGHRHHRTVRPQTRRQRILRRYILRSLNKVVQQYCRRAMSVSSERLCQFIVDLIRFRDWYNSDDKCILDRDEICDIIKYLAAG